MQWWNPVTLPEMNMPQDAALNWCLHRRPVSPEDISSEWKKEKKKKRGDESKTLLTLICSVLDRKVSKQSPGAGAFWWTKLPAWRLHVSQVNKTQKREGRKGEAGGSVRPEEGGDRCKPMVVFLQTSGDVWTESGSRFSPFVRFFGGNQVWNPGVSVSNMIYLLTFSFH